MRRDAKHRPIPVKELADSAADFVVLSYDPPAGRYKAKTARAWHAGRKLVVHVTTDKGWFDLTYDHPVRLSNHQVCRAGELETGMSLFACAVDRQHGHLRVHLRDGMKGKQFLHAWCPRRHGIDLTGKIVHHKDGNVDPTTLKPEAMTLVNTPPSRGPRWANKCSIWSISPRGGWQRA
jgi:hypothetical protein